ncbi:hypothetical protein HK101_003435 [Irineochytrium annulatum]|nr:hypothetical protein HK101_003435 [Irineochytrium annulatum]
MMLTWFLWTPFFAAGAIRDGLAPPLIVQPNLFGFLAVVCYAQCWMFGKKRGWTAGLAYGCAWLVFVGGLEVGLWWLLGVVEGSENGSVKALGIVIRSLGPLLVIGGFLPQFVDIFKAKSCFGISPIFVFLDILGGVFSILSLVFHPPPFDIISSLSYAGVIFMDLIITLLGWIYGWGPPKGSADAGPSSAPATADDGEATFVTATEVPEAALRMLLQNTILAILALLASTIVFYVHVPSRNVSLLCLSVMLALNQLNYLLFSWILPAISPADATAWNETSNSIDPNYKYSSASFETACNVQAFFSNALGASLFGTACSLAIELYLRTKAKTVLDGATEAWRLPKNWLYLTLSFAIPTLIGICCVVFRYGVSAHYIKDSFCDVSLPPVWFIVLFGVINAIYSIVGSIFTILALVTYIRRRSLILSAINMSDEQYAVSNGNGTFGGMPRPSGSSTRSTLNGGAGSMVSLNREMHRMNARELVSQAKSTARGLLQVLQRMAIWCLGFHVLAWYFTYSEFATSVNEWSKPSIGGGDDQSHGRTSLIMYFTATLSLLVLGCFGTGENAVSRYAFLSSVVGSGFSRRKVTDATTATAPDNGVGTVEKPFYDGDLRRTPSSMGRYPGAFRESVGLSQFSHTPNAIMPLDAVTEHEV